MGRRRYQKLVGRLIYLAHTKPKLEPKLAYALNIVSQFVHNFGEQQMNVDICILRYPKCEYLKSAPEKEIMFSKNANK